MVKWLIITVLLLPAAEIVVFMAMTVILGLPVTLFLMLATSLAGVLVLRRAGRQRIAGFRVAVADSDITAIQANTNGFLMVLAGLFLLLPGFLTDLAGIILLVGPLRRRCGEAIRQALRERERCGRPVVDLAPGEWRQVPETETKASGAARRTESEG